MEQLFTKARPKTLRAEVVEMLRAAIVRGKLQPGDHLKEAEIAAQMSVSRSPIREAFRQLEHEGLIESIPNQGCYVKSYSAKEIKEIFTVRAALESLACELLIRDNKLGQSEYGVLENYLERQKKAVERRDFERLTDLDMDFHEYICHLSGSERLLKMWRSLRGQIQVLFYLRFRVMEKVPETVETDHLALFAALKTGNVEEIAQMNKTINARVAQDCINVFAGE